MSLESMITPASPQAQLEGVEQDSKQDIQSQPTRSWRKKYRKLRQRFGRVMAESNAYTKDEARALALTRRLQEENDQILDMLVDVHQTGSFTLVVDATGIDVASDIASLTTAATAETDESYLSTLLQMPHKSYELSDISEAIANETSSNYMDAAYREEYIANLDNQLTDSTFFSDPNKTLKPPPSRVVPSEKELQTRNADSVISWLRRHHPETFIQDKDHEKEKPEPRKRGGGKRASLAAPVVKPEPEEGEEETTVVADPPEKTGRNKKSKDDEPYRPKGGSSRNAKRKRAEDGDQKPTGRGKRAKA